jgi:hypothetical protein
MSERIVTLVRDGVVLQVTATDVAPPEYPSALDNGGVLLTNQLLGGLGRYQRAVLGR